MPKGRVIVRTDRVTIYDQAHDEYRCVTVDSDGDFYIQDGCGDDALTILIRKTVIGPLIRALRRAEQF